MITTKAYQFRNQWVRLYVFGLHSWQLCMVWVSVSHWRKYQCSSQSSNISHSHQTIFFSISISISNNFIVSQYTFSTIHMYTKRLHQHIHKQFSESIQCYGSKWSWKSWWIYGLLVWYTKYHLSQQGCKGAGGATVTTHFVSNMQHTAL